LYGNALTVVAVFLVLGFKFGLLERKSIIIRIRDGNESASWRNCSAKRCGVGGVESCVERADAFAGGAEREVVWTHRL
jgi:hypothetical protein